MSEPLNREKVQAIADLIARRFGGVYTSKAALWDTALHIYDEHIAAALRRRDERLNASNEIELAQLKEIDALKAQLEVVRHDLERVKRENEWFRAAHLLIAQGDAFVAAPEGDVFWYVKGAVTEDGTPALALNMNDVFAWACADAEPFSYEDAPALLHIAVTEGWPGLNRWASAKRGCPPQNPVLRDMEVYDQALANAQREIESLKAQLKERGE